MAPDTKKRSVLDSGDVDAMWSLAGTPDGVDDLELTERLLHALPDSDTRHAALAARPTL